MADFFIRTVFNAFMKKIFTSFFTFFFVCLLFGCAKKETFFFSKDTGSFGPYQQIQRKIKPPMTKPAVSDAEKLTAKNNKSNLVVYTAAIEPGISSAIVPEPVKINATVVNPTATFRTKANPLAKAPLRRVHLNKAFPKKLLKAVADEDKPVHKLATLSLILSLASAFLLLLTILLAGAGVGILSGLILLTALGGIITSRLALKAIRNNPDKFSGEGRARVGFIIGLVTGIIYVLLLIAFIIILIAFLANLS